ncbi:MAG: LPS export ABC transporter periplasmic protein LptC [Cellvibrionales bacterium]|nr:LPS export ABC transporter periplasmic protein LptC [Cellvibrionales bacterium]|tara:strand:+ start:2401 stop:3042 length:642 start_codon:yes stop_codon:yes gene_type:complete
MFAKKRQKQIRNLLALGISCAMIAFYALNLNFNSLFNTANPASNHKQKPVSILDNVEIRQFDSQGQLQQYLTANRAEMITETNDKNKDSFASTQQELTAKIDSKKNKLRLIQPHMIIHEKNNKPLTITANEGLIGHRDKKTQLTGNVEINDIDRQAKVFTQSLTIDSKANILSTDQAISIESPTTTTTASGLEADLNKNQWHLLSGVKSVINP